MTIMIPEDHQQFILIKNKFEQEGIAVQEIHGQHEKGFNENYVSIVIKIDDLFYKTNWSPLIFSDDDFSGCFVNEHLRGTMPNDTKHIKERIWDLNESGIACIDSMLDFKVSHVLQGYQMSSVLEVFEIADWLEELLEWRKKNSKRLGYSEVWNKTEELNEVWMKKIEKCGNCQANE